MGYPEQSNGYPFILAGGVVMDYEKPTLLFEANHVETPVIKI